MKFNLTSIIWLGFFTRILIAVLDYVAVLTDGTTFLLSASFTGSDLWRLHDLAVLKMQGMETSGISSTSEYYTTFLSYVYWLSTDSIVIANFLACVAWLLSAFVLLRILNLFSISYKNIAMALILFVFLPSSLINTSAGIREAYQLLFVNFSIYCFLIIYFYKDIRLWLILPIILSLLTLLHIAFLPWCLFLFTAVLISTRLRSVHLNRYKLLGLLLFSTLLIALLYSSALVPELLGIGEKGLVNAVLLFQEGSIATGLESRATYRFFLPESGGFIDSSVFLIIGFFQYLFEPMPWKISSMLDLVLIAENFLRALMLFLGIKALFYVKNDNRTILLLFILLFLILEFIWSVGTTNWGTASRHHVPSLGIMLLMGFVFKDSIMRTNKT